MFKKVSKAGVGVVGLIVFVVILIGESFGVTIAEANATQFAQNIIGIVSFVMTVWGQADRKDVTALVVRNGE